MAGAEDLLVVEDLVKHFPITRGIVFQKQVASVKAVDGISFTVKQGETLMALATWKQLIDLGSMQDGEEHLRATARTPVARINRAMYESVFGMLETQPGAEQHATITGDRGSVTLPVVVANMPDGVVWLPARSFGRGVLAELASPGSTVTLKGAS